MALKSNLQSDLHRPAGRTHLQLEGDTLTLNFSQAKINNITNSRTTSSTVLSSCKIQVLLATVHCPNSFAAAFLWRDGLPSNFPRNDCQARGLRKLGFTSTEHHLRTAIALENVINRENNDLRYA